MVDNFKQIRNHLKFDEKGDHFYFVQILQRAKDFGNETTVKGTKVIRSFYVSDLDYWDSHVEQIKSLCEYYNARAYIHLNPRSWRKCVLKSFGTLADFLQNDQCHLLRTLVEKTAGDQIADGVEKTWIVDVDSKDDNLIREIADDVNACGPEGNKIVDAIPTVHGVHLITKPFNIQKFRKKWKESELDVHKNNPTLLYYCFSMEF